MSLDGLQHKLTCSMCCFFIESVKYSIKMELLNFVFFFTVVGECAPEYQCQQIFDAAAGYL